MKAFALILLAGTCAASAQTIGTVPVADATVTTQGHVADVANGRAALIGSSVVTARDRAAEVRLARGGTILVCRTSGLHVAGTPDTLAIGLDRGAVEFHTKATATDAILTPDLRITSSGGTLDLRLRVSANGDTCVENRGRRAPLLNISDTFGEASYQVKPGQHVLFEHGSLREVVDRETTPCGCPPEDPRPVPLAEALLHGGAGTVTPKQAEAAHPFPTAQSEGLEPITTPPADAPGVTHMQVATTIAVDPTTIRQAAPAVPPPAADNGVHPFRAVGHFFKRIFVR